MKKQGWKEEARSVSNKKQVIIFCISARNRRLNCLMINKYIYINKIVPKTSQNLRNHAMRPENILCDDFFTQKVIYGKY